MPKTCQPKTKKIFYEKLTKTIVRMSKRFIAVDLDELHKMLSLFEATKATCECSWITSVLTHGPENTYRMDRVGIVLSAYLDLEDDAQATDDIRANLHPLVVWEYTHVHMAFKKPGSKRIEVFTTDESAYMDMTRNGWAYEQYGKLTTGLWTRDKRIYSP